MGDEYLTFTRLTDGVGRRITPSSAGWRYVGFETRTLKQGAKSKVDTGSEEICGVILSAKPGSPRQLKPERGRRAPACSSRLPWSFSTAAARASSHVQPAWALCSAPASGKFKARVIKPTEVGTLTRKPARTAVPGNVLPRRRRGRERARGRSHHAGRQLVQLPAAQARPRRAAGQILSRGNLLSPPEARPRASPSSAFIPTTVRSTRRWR